jgi:nucleoside-diphosphate-sugar epimerase
MRSLFITGIGGFIGRRLAERALERGVAVSGIDVAEKAVLAARRIGVDAHQGDITDPARLRQLVGAVDAVVHTAAIVREYGPLEAFRRVNVAGSVCVAKAARDAGVRTFVQLSSVMVYGFDYPADVTESGPLRGEGNPYCQTKIESEAAVLALNAPPSFGVIVIRPGDVYGPGSIPWVARPLRMLERRRLFLPMRGAGLINHVYVDNLVDGIFLAIDARAYGKAFNVTDGDATSYQDFFSRLAARAGLRPPRALPAALMMGGAAVIGRLRDLGLTKDEASVDTVRYLMRKNRYSIANARADLGYVPRVALEDGLALTQPFIDETVARRHETRNPTDARARRETT